VIVETEEKKRKHMGDEGNETSFRGEGTREKKKGLFSERKKERQKERTRI